MEAFKVTRVYADENGDSCFDEIYYPLHNGGPIGYLSEKFSVKDLIFRKVLPTYDDFHTAPHRQFVILLDGGVEIETSTGERRQFAAGEVLLMEDTDGKGHRSRNLKEQVRSSLFITFD
ncbi:hypothetical protein IM792_05345 [Mucilaginibacter sp. JRF]|uniref:hypothetical protein n=1 Tax=Mucilaginibacter sp. JRF TaxID=2780088 RepID=UPI00188025E4|nr:hypothetical protein [Mucilaginibacter sp. JRF]MBE9583864.1 hypothetical protein [Mucilaginibacter sp. JRF]